MNYAVKAGKSKQAKNRQKKIELCVLWKIEYTIPQNKIRPVERERARKKEKNVVLFHSDSYSYLFLSFFAWRQYWNLKHCVPSNAKPANVPYIKLRTQTFIFILFLHFYDFHFVSLQLWRSFSVFAMRTKSSSDYYIYLINVCEEKKWQHTP